MADGNSRSLEARMRTLSEKRAAAVKGWLAKHGIAPTRLETAGFGQTKPAVPNDSAEGRQANRRVELVKR